MPKSRILTNIFNKLLDTYGSQSWWPADSPFEVVVGAVLTQNTAWSGVEKAVAALKDVCEMTPEGVLSIPVDSLERAVRPSGYFRQKAARLRGICRFLVDEYGGLEGMEREETAVLRDILLSLRGIGPETADSILLYALGRPVFVVDAYTVRLLSRLGLCGEREKYDAVQALFMDSLDPDAEMFNEYHALIVRHSKERCRKRKPDCDDCALGRLCTFAHSRFQIPDSR